MFLGAGSVMHGMDDDVDMRHYGALRKAHAGHLHDLRDGLPRDHRLPAVLRLLVQGQDHRDRARPTTRWSACAALLGAGVTGFYMTRLMLMTFFSEKRWEKDVHPHESPKVMTVPLIVLAALSAARRPAAARRLDRRLPRAGGRRERRARGAADPAAGGDRADRRWSWSPSASPSPGSLVGRKRGARARRRQDVSFVHPGGPRRPLRRRDQRRRCVVGPGRSLVAGLPTFDRRGGRRRRRGRCRWRSAGRRPAAAQGPERLRPLLRPLPARRRRCSSSWPCWR